MKTGEVSKLIQQDLGLTYDELAGMSEQEYAARIGLNLSTTEAAEIKSNQAALSLFNRHKTNLLEAEAAVFATEEVMRQVREELGYNEGAVLNQVLEIPTGGSEMAALGFGTLQSTVAKMGEVLPNMSQEVRLKLLMSMAASFNPSQHAGFQNWDGSKVDPKTFQEFALNNRESKHSSYDSCCQQTGYQYLILWTLSKDSRTQESWSTPTSWISSTQMQKRTTRQYAPTVYDVIPGMGKAQLASIKANLADTNEQAAVVDPQTGALVAGDEFLKSWSELNTGALSRDDFDIASATVKNVKFNIANIGQQGGTVEVTIVDSKGNAVDAQIPMSKFDNPAVQDYVSTDAYRIMRQAANQFAAGIDLPVVHLRNTETGNISRFRLTSSVRLTKTSRPVCLIV